MLLASRRWRSERSVSAWLWKSSAVGEAVDHLRTPRFGCVDAVALWAAPAQNMSANSAAKAAHFEAAAAPRRHPRVQAVKTPSLSVLSRVRTRARLVRWRLAALLAAPTLAPGRWRSDGGLDPDTLQRIQALGEHAGAGLAPGAMRVEIEPGRLDPRLRLAPCERIEPYLPPGARAWGRSRVGLRCVAGADALERLPAGDREGLRAGLGGGQRAAGRQRAAARDDLRQAEVDWAATATPPVLRRRRLVGRQLARPLPAGAAVRLSDLKTAPVVRRRRHGALVARRRLQRQRRGPGARAGVEGQPCACAPRTAASSAASRWANAEVELAL